MMEQWKISFNVWLRDYPHIHAEQYYYSNIAFKAGYEAAIKASTMNIKHPPIVYPEAVIKKDGCFGESSVQPKRMEVTECTSISGGPTEHNIDDGKRGKYYEKYWNTLKHMWREDHDE